MSTESIYIEQFGVQLGKTLLEFRDLYPEKDNEMDLKNCYAQESVGGNPHFDLLQSLLSSSLQCKQTIDSVIFTATKIESYGLSGNFDLQSICENFSLPLPVLPIFGYGCAGFLGVLKHHLSGFRKCLWISCDARGISDTRLLGNNALMSDAAGFCVLSKEKGRFRVIDVELEQSGAFHMIDEDQEQWNKTYFLSMNVLFRKIMKKNDMDISSVKYVIPHFTNLKAWELFQRFMKFSNDQLFRSAIRDIGHLYGMDLMYALQKLDSENQLLKGDRLLFLSVGVGATFGVLLLEVCE